MPIVALHTIRDTTPVRFATAPWNDTHPQRRDIDARLPPDHLARQINDAVARLDLTALYATYQGTGSPPHPPEGMLKVVLYQTRQGHHRPAQWHKDAHECEPVRWLLDGARPARSCWYAFRDRLGPLLLEFNRQILTQAIDAGLTPATRAAQDGTTIAANASRHHLVNQDRLHKRLQQLEVALANEQGPQAPADDTAAPGAAADPADRTQANTGPLAEATPTPTAPAAATPAAVPAWMASTARGRRQQQQRLHQAQRRLQQLQARNHAKRSSKRKAADKVVVSLSDPESMAGRDKEGVYRPLYNVQIVDDLDSPFLLGYEVFAQQNDAGLLGTMLPRLRQLLGHQVQVLLADTAYASGADLAAAVQHGVQVYAPLPTEAGENKTKQLPKSQFCWCPEEATYVCPQGHRLVYVGSCQTKHSGPEPVVQQRYRCPAEHCRACPLRARCMPKSSSGRSISRGEHEDLIEALRARMATAEAKALYRLRRQSVELVNADWKQHRQLRRFSGRGLARVRCQVALVVLSHNLVTLLAQERKAAAKVAETASDTTRNPAEITT